jgi:hypothetical protein
MGDTIEQSATSTQTAVNKPRIETLSEAKPDEADGAAITEPTDAEDIPVGLFSQVAAVCAGKISGRKSVPVATPRAIAESW